MCTKGPMSLFPSSSDTPQGYQEDAVSMRSHHLENFSAMKSEQKFKDTAPAHKTVLRT